ncbi:MAG: hypothetical protein ACTS5F_00140 [Candidatus Hodgkinia cicadicola]
MNKFRFQRYVGLLTKIEGEFDFGNVRTLIVGNSPSKRVKMKC